MFYSHELLTDRKHGVATIWLVATLGSRSSLKKVTRKAILDVEISKACETITDAERPMALRLQGSLLYGVSRVFSQQCGYVLTDAQGLSEKMRGVTLTMRRNLQIDLNVATMNLNQLNIPDDPAFNIDCDMAFDLSAFDVPSETSEKSSLLSPRTLDSSQSSLPIRETEDYDLILPSIDTPGIGFVDSVLKDMGTSSAIKTGGFDVDDLMDGPAVFDDSAFVMGDDGELLTIEEMEAAGLDRNMSLDNPADVEENELQLGEEHQAAAQNQANDNFEIDDFIAFEGHDEEPVLSEQPPSPRQVDLHHLQTENPESPSTKSGDQNQTEHSTNTAPQKRTREPKPLEPDSVALLSNGQLTSWGREYTQNMEHAANEKAKKQAASQGKRNADFWVLDQGIGGFKVNFGGDLTTHPFAVFSGQTLIDALTGSHSSIVGRKRDWASTEQQDEDDNLRRVRARSEGAPTSRVDDEPLVVADDDPMVVQGFEDNVESEVGRKAPSSLDMPWSMSSRPGSARPYGSGLGRTSSIPGLPSANLGPGSDLIGRRSRLTSASPLVGKSQVVSRLSSVEPHGHAITTFGADDFDDFQTDLDAGLNDDFELHGSGVAVSTQTAAQNQLTAAALEKEAQNFFTYLASSIEHGERSNLELDEISIQTITFAKIVPPKTNTKAAGAQGFLHVLLLATQNLIEVEQNEDFDSDIVLGIREDNEMMNAVQADGTQSMV